MNAYSVGAKAGMMEAIQNMTSVRKIDDIDTDTTDLVTAPESTLMPPSFNSSIVPFESYLAIGAKPLQYDIDLPPQAGIFRHKQVITIWIFTMMLHKQCGTNSGVKINKKLTKRKSSLASSIITMENIAV